MASFLEYFEGIQSFADQGIDLRGIPSDVEVELKKNLPGLRAASPGLVDDFAMHHGSTVSSNAKARIIAIIYDNDADAAKAAINSIDNLTLLPEDGPDVWTDPGLFKSVFLSAGLATALSEAGMAKAFRLAACNTTK